MKTQLRPALPFSLVALAALLACSSVLVAEAAPVNETILFNDTVQRGTAWTNAPDTIEIDPTFKSPGTDTSTLKLTMTGAYRSGGLAFWGEDNVVHVPEDQPVLQVFVYTTDADAMNDFQIDTSVGKLDFNNTKGSWTLDGEPGKNYNLTPNTWHILRFDLTSIPNFVAGSSYLNGQVSFKTKDTDATVYFGDIRLTPQLPVE